jgi:tetratricopeptide (TPR) repeat protein
MRTRHLLWMVLTCAAIAGCHARPPSAASESRDLCLAEPDGGAPVDDAIRHTQGQARKLPTEPHSWSLVGQGWVRKARMTTDPGFYVNVRACAEAALVVAPNNRAALQLRGLALMNDHRFEEARGVADDILSREPNDALTLGVQSDALLELGRFDEAAAASQRMVDVHPDMASYSRAAYFRWLEGDTDHAKLFMRYALNGRDIQDREPTAWTFVQAATMYWNEGDYEGADAVLAEALKWAPDYAPALVGRGRVAISLKRPQQAIDYLDKAYAKSPLPETAWLLGDAREMVGDHAGAAKEYARVLRDGRATDRLTLGLFLATKGLEPEEALRLIDTERKTRGGVYLDDAYAWALYRTGRIGDARTASDQALRLGTRDARLLYHAGAIRLAAGDVQGRDLIRQALRLNPRFDWTASNEASRMLADATLSLAR